MADEVQRPWWVLAVVGVAIAVGAYVLGAHQAGAWPVPAEAGAAHYHHHFGFFPFGLFFGFFWIVILMRLFMWGRWGGGPWRYYRYGPQWYDDPARWDEWHRRAHEHMNTKTNGDDSRR